MLETNGVAVYLGDVVVSFGILDIPVGIVVQGKIVAFDNIGVFPTVVAIVNLGVLNSALPLDPLFPLFPNSPLIGFLGIPVVIGFGPLTI